MPQLLPADELKFTPVICLSASKLVEGDNGGIERRLGYTYVQGSGDDHELWSEGLDPSLFWEHHATFLTTPASELIDLVREVVSQRSGRMVGTEIPASFPIAKARGLLVLRPSTLASTNTMSAPNNTTCSIVITDDEAIVDNDNPSEGTFNPVLRLRTTSAYAKRRDLLPFFRRHNLDRAIEFAHTHVLGNDKTLEIAATPTTEEEMIGLALVLLQSVFDDDGRLREEANIPNVGNGAGRDNVNVTKETLRMRLQWIQASAPTMNPSRAVLKLVNAYFMSPRS